MHGYDYKNMIKKKVLKIIPRLQILVLLGLTFSLASQDPETLRKIKGTVKTSIGTPVEGAFIFIDRQIYNKRTRPNGKFSLKVPADADSITIFTLDGWIVSGLISNRITIDLVMDTVPKKSGFYVKQGVQEIIDLGYYRSEANKMTSSTGLIKSYEEKGTYQNVYEMIKGEVPGVWVRRNQIIIRGKGTFQLGTQPLIVVDGVPMQSILHIQPSDVESISVLKGAATTAYGARGSNGVIIINLKKKNK